MHVHYGFALLCHLCANHGLASIYPCFGKQLYEIEIMLSTKQLLTCFMKIAPGSTQMFFVYHQIKLEITQLCCVFISRLEMKELVWRHPSIAERIITASTTRPNRIKCPSCSSVMKYRIRRGSWHFTLQSFLKPTDNLYPTTVKKSHKSVNR